MPDAILVRETGGPEVLRLEPTGLEYWLSTSHARDRDFEAAAIAKYPNLDRWELLKRLARSYPHGAIHLGTPQ